MLEIYTCCGGLTGEKREGERRGERTTKMKSRNSGAKGERMRNVNGDDT